MMMMKRCKRRSQSTTSMLLLLATVCNFYCLTTVSVMAFAGKHYLPNFLSQRHSSSLLRSAAAEAVTTTTTTTATAEASTHRTRVVEHSHCQEPGDRDILVRAARGETCERTPVWLMRQAGRYMSAFREYSDHYAFRQRSETPDMAIELSTQCHDKYGMDGIIMFSDILTPLPVLGIDFDVKKGLGPVITTVMRTKEDVLRLPDEYNFDEKLPFIRQILTTLSQRAEEANTSLIGFVGAPFTLAAYTLEGKSSKHCLVTKQLMLEEEANPSDANTMSLFLDKLADMIGNYGIHQIECGAQVLQVFESWAHQLSPRQFERFAKPAAQKAIQMIKQKYPHVPIIYFCNGGTTFLELQRDMGCDMIGVDWRMDLAEAKQILGPNVPISGNVDPTILLLGTKEQIEAAVRECIDKAGGPGKHVLNLGHGVMQGTPEEAVQWFVDEAKRYRGK